MREEGTRGAAVAGVGYAVPEQVVANAAIAERLGVEEEWISRRTGTRERHVVSDGERLSDLAARAAERALVAAGADAASLDMVVVATTSADELSPHAAPLVAGRIGARGAAAIDISAACTGFLAGLALATSAIEAGRAERTLVIGADALSRFLDLDDRTTSPLFGDGAGAAVVTATADGSRIGPIRMHSDARGAPLIQLTRREPLIRMDGPQVYREAVRMLVDVTREATEAAGVALEDVDLFVYHQANSRIVRAVGERLGLDESRVVDLVGRFGNTSAATLPIALGVAEEEGRLRRGDRVLLAAFGAGFVWAGAVVRW